MGHVILATRTLEAIENAIKADQGSRYRGFLGQVIPHMGDAYRTGNDPFRSHMGASMIGGECARKLWYGFHWTTIPDFSGQTIRLFNRGHLEEARFIACLLTIGCQVYQQDAEGNQFRISDAGGHFGGSGDGVAMGIPDVPPGTACLLEFKTSNDSNFRKMKEDGVRASKFEHYVQMNIYMHKMGIACALYMVVNKNNDELYGEIVPLDVEIAEQFTQRARTIIPIQFQPPERIGKSAGYFGCKFCDEKPVCHNGKLPARNCRTCHYARSDMADGKWWCDNKERQMQLLFPDTNPFNEDFSLSKDRQLASCEHYKMNEAYK